MNRGSGGKARLAIIGCGAVTEERYLPAAAAALNFAVTHLADLNVERGKSVAERFGVPNFVADYRELLDEVDGVIVATPPSSHGPITIGCLERGLPVLCEKPLTTSSDEARAMIAASERHGALLAVAMVRRLSWSSQLLKRLMQMGVLGEVQRFDLESGGEYGWPVRDGHTFQSGTSGGVVADFGPHMLDLSFWSMDGRNPSLVDYADDNWGGVEANAVIDLTVEVGSRRVPGRLELSFSRTLRNTLRIHGEKGYIEAPVGGGHEVRFQPEDGSEPVVMKFEGASVCDRVTDFATQLSHFGELVTNRAGSYATAGEALTVISLLEQCRRSTRMTVQPWESVGLEQFFLRGGDVD